MRTKHSMSSIFVSIASFKDSEIFNTIKDLFERAKHPDRIYVGVLLQDTEDVIKNFNIHFTSTNIKMLSVTPEQAAGCGWARNEIMKHLYGKEDYFLLVDSHSRFKKEWDELYIDMLKNTPGKSVLSGFPREYQFKEDYEEYSQRDLVSIYIPNEVPHVENTTRTVTFVQKLAKGKNERVMNISGGNMFGPGDIVNILKLKTYNYYGYCEQELYSLLLYQCGYDIYAPHENLIWHKYFVLGHDNYRERYKEKATAKYFWPDVVNLTCSLAAKGEQPIRSAEDWIKEYKDFIKRNEKKLETYSFVPTLSSYFANS